MQVLSGGMYKATPHAVVAPRSAYAAGLSRNTFAVFMQPNFDDVLRPPKGHDSQEVVKVDEWEEGVTFGRFASLKFERYYSGLGSGSGRMEAQLSGEEEQGNQSAAAVH